MKKKLNLLLVAPIVLPISSNLKYAGTERVIDGLNHEFKNNKKLRVKPIVVASGDSDLSGNKNLVYFYKKALWTLKNDMRKIFGLEDANEKHYRFGLKFAIENNIDIIHDNASLLSSVTYKELKDRINIPIISTIHGNINKKKKYRYKILRQLQKENRDIYFITISKNHMKRFSKDSGLKILDYVYNGIPVDKYKFVQKNKKQDYLFWIGRICEEKGTDLAIKVAKAAKMPLILAGEIHSPNKKFYEKQIKPYITSFVPGKNDKEKEKNRKKIIEKLNRGEKIIKENDILYIGPVNDKEKGVLNSYAYSLIMLNRWEEPFGLVMPEAMVTGTPVIGSKNGAIPEIVINNKTGFVIPLKYINKKTKEFDEEKLVRDSVKALKKINSIKAEDCREHVMKNFSLEAMATKYRRMYDYILKNGKIKNKTR